jgi:hypothetical protein
MVSVYPVFSLHKLSSGIFDFQNCFWFFRAEQARVTVPVVIKLDKAGRSLSLGKSVRSTQTVEEGEIRFMQFLQESHEMKV